VAASARGEPLGVVEKTSEDQLVSFVKKQGARRRDGEDACEGKGNQLGCGGALLS